MESPFQQNFQRLPNAGDQGPCQRRVAKRRWEAVPRIARLGFTVGSRGGPGCLSRWQQRFVKRLDPHTQCLAVLLYFTVLRLTRSYELPQHVQCLSDDQRCVLVAKVRETPLNPNLKLRMEEGCIYLSRRMNS